MARNTWFDETFLPSFEEKMNNPKYPNQCILSEKQAEICAKYMEAREGHDSDYHKRWIFYVYKVGCREYTVWSMGRYTFMKRLRVPYKIEARLIRRMRWNRQEMMEDKVGFYKEETV